MEVVVTKLELMEVVVTKPELNRDFSEAIFLLSKVLVEESTDQSCVETLTNPTVRFLIAVNE